MPYRIRHLHLSSGIVASNRGRAVGESASDSVAY